MMETIHIEKRGRKPKVLDPTNDFTLLETYSGLKQLLIKHGREYGVAEIGTPTIAKLWRKTSGLDPDQKLQFIQFAIKSTHYNNRRTVKPGDIKLASIAMELAKKIANTMVNTMSNTMSNTTPSTSMNPPVNTPKISSSTNTPMFSMNHPVSATNLTDTKKTPEKTLAALQPPKTPIIAPIITLAKVSPSIASLSSVSPDTNKNTTTTKKTIPLEIKKKK